jgi:hypothetical protein
MRSRASIDVPVPGMAADIERGFGSVKHVAGSTWLLTPRFFHPSWGAVLDTPKPPLFKFSVPTYYGDISFFDAHLLGEEKNEFAVR